MFYEVEQRLVAWVHYEWAVAGNDVGFSPRNHLCAFSEGGSNQYPTTGICLISHYSEQQRTAMLIREMGKEFPELEKTVKEYYLNPEHISIGKIAFSLGISTRTLSRRILDAKSWLATRLGI